MIKKYISRQINYAKLILEENKVDEYSFKFIFNLYKREFRTQIYKIDYNCQTIDNIENELTKISKDILDEYLELYSDVINIHMLINIINENKIEYGTITVIDTISKFIKEEDGRLKTLKLIINTYNKNATDILTVLNRIVSKNNLESTNYSDSNSKIIFNLEKE